MQTSFRLDDPLLDRVNALLSGTQTVSQFAYEATKEKANRMEARNERARMQLAVRDRELLKPIIEDVLRENGVIE